MKQNKVVPVLGVPVAAAESAPRSAKDADAAVETQAIHRGKSARQKTKHVRKSRKETTAPATDDHAAVKIQAAHRGKAARKKHGRKKAHTELQP